MRSTEQPVRSGTPVVESMTERRTTEGRKEGRRKEGRSKDRKGAEKNLIIDDEDCLLPLFGWLLRRFGYFGSACYGFACFGFGWHYITQRLFYRRAFSPPNYRCHAILVQTALVETVSCSLCSFLALRKCVPTFYLSFLFRLTHHAQHPHDAAAGASYTSWRCNTARQQAMQHAELG